MASHQFKQQSNKKKMNHKKQTQEMKNAILYGFFFWYSLYEHDIIKYRFDYPGWLLIIDIYMFDYVNVSKL